MLNIQVTVSEKIAEKFDAMPDLMRKALVRKVYELTLRLESHVKNDKLSGQVLNTKSGRLKRSIQHSVFDGGDKIIGQVFSTNDVPYNAIHEYGGRTPPHDIFPVKAQALAFMYNGKMTFAKVVHHPGSLMPERSYLRSSLQDMKGTIEREITEEVKKALL